MITESITAKELENTIDVRQQISTIFVEGFYQWLHYFSHDKAKLILAFKHMFNTEVFHVLLKNGEVAGVAALSDKNLKAIRIDGQLLRKHLGFVKGSIASFMLKKHLEKKKYPFGLTDETGVIEFVATKQCFLRLGVARELISGIIDSGKYKEYVLEVADTNSAAVALYEKLGFKEFMRIKDKRPKKSGLNYYLYLKYFKA